jgi:hypothetical protein
MGMRGGSSNELWLALHRVESNGLMQVSIHIPAGYTNGVDIFRTDDLLHPVWDLAAADLEVESGSNVVAWTDTASATNEIGFYAAANADWDSDSDGLSDGKEKFVYQTDPWDDDTDGDALTDGWEVTYGFDPNDASGENGGQGDPDGDGLSNVEEQTLNTNPRAADEVTCASDLFVGGAAYESYKTRKLQRNKFNEFPAFEQPTNGPPVYFLQLTRREDYHYQDKYEECTTIYSESTRDYDLSLHIDHQTMLANGTVLDTFSSYDYPDLELEGELTVSWTNNRGTEITLYEEPFTIYNRTNTFSGVGYMDYFGNRHHGDYYVPALTSAYPGAQTDLDSFMYTTNSSENGEEWCWTESVEVEYQLSMPYTLSMLEAAAAADVIALATNSWDDIEWGERQTIRWGPELNVGEAAGHPDVFLGDSENYSERFLNESETSLTLSQSKYKFTAWAETGRIYRLTWVEQFTPDSETNPNGTPEILAVKSAVFIGSGDWTTLEDDAYVLDPPDQGKGNGKVSITRLRVDIAQEEEYACASESNLTLTLTGSFAPDGYDWSSSPAGLSATENEAVYTIDPSASTPGSYLVRAEAEGYETCSDACAVHIVKADIALEETNHCIHEGSATLTLTIESHSPGNAYTWTWPAGLSGSASNGQFTYTPSNSTPGSYTVSCNPAHAQGCSDVCTVNILKVEITNLAGVPLAQNVRTVPGRKIALKGKVTPGDLEVTDHQWTIGGNRIKSYTQSLNEGVKVELESSDLEADTVEFYWIDGGEDIEVKYEAVVAGHPVSAVVNLDVERPTATLTSVTTPLEPPISIRLGYLRFGYPAPNEEGIRWNAEVTAPDIGSGQIAFVQLVNLYRTRTLKDEGNTTEIWTSNGQYYLDTSGGNPLYGDDSTTIGGGATQAHSKSDSPGSPLHSVSPPGYQRRSANDNFRLYLMYKPSGDDSIWVTLRRLDWLWSGAAARNESDEWVMESGQSSSQNPGSANSIELPLWPGRAQEIEWQPVD